MAGFAFSFFSVAMIEWAGPASSSEGRVIDTVRQSGTTTICARARCSQFSAPGFSVVGERTDGSTWVVVGESAYEAMRSEQGLIDVQTSSITGRVVGLVPERGNGWSIARGGQTVFAVGALLAAFGFIFLWNWSRRHENFKYGTYRRAEFARAVPAVIIGVGLTWYVMFARGASLDVPSSEDAAGGFLADPVRFAADEPSRVDDGEPIPTGAWVGQIGREVTVVGFDDLAPELRAVVDVEGQVLAIPVMQKQSGLPEPANLRLVGPDQFFVDGIEPIGCPESIPAYTPERDGSRGFVCFDADQAEGRSLLLTIGLGQITDGPFTMEFDAVFVS